MASQPKMVDRLSHDVIIETSCGQDHTAFLSLMGQAPTPQPRVLPADGC